MAEFFLELFSEEIPARMQAQAAANLAKIVGEALGPVQPRDVVTFYGARRIALAANISPEMPASETELRGPKLGAPSQAIDGFLRKNQAERDELVEEGGHFLLRRHVAARPAADVILADLGKALAAFPWPKSMRWGQSAAFTWVRPLRRIVCLLDGAVVPIALGTVVASDLSEGHRFLAPGTFKVVNAAQWQAELRQRRVIADATARRAMIADGLQREAQALGLSIVKDDGLLDEVTGLVEYPVPLIGRIEQRFMALPPEVRELSMKVNQRYFSMRDAAGEPAPYFAFVANIEASDGGAAIIAGNERVLRARLADAEHFWAQDRQHPLEDYLPKLKSVVFHAKLGTQFERAERISTMAGVLASLLGVTLEDAYTAQRAGLLCKADLVTGMVGEFPELQGIIGGYYAGDNAIGRAIRTHYQPKGPTDEVPRGLVPSIVALADKFDTLIKFFECGERPTGSGDPYALRRAALGVIRIIVENGLPLPLNEPGLIVDHSLLDFILDRLRVKLRTEGRRFDILDSVLAKGKDFNLVRLMRKIDAIESFLQTDDGLNLLAAYRRAANILRIESAKDGPYLQNADPEQLREDTERQLAALLHERRPALSREIESENYNAAMKNLAAYRKPIDQFFNDVTVNADDPSLRLNRLFLLNDFVKQFDQIADFSKLEG
ncbi:glycine--tRNA ligase subunit beta [Acidiphilium sp. PA]|uniref:glycine--tRNA ligase subunit beta n=1 Tax=Acidiphilium sp. PA TaxID=2871705 RepID=UPI0022446C30|nr:glycine--tRNA ligase subunit beta [Acidiphilium sp. PA]MCW8307472.1 glycine--tRNA ligase subunit beta [Acidiphilium sp. PA]